MHKMKKKGGVVVCIVIALAMMVVMGLKIVEKYTPSDVHISPEEFYSVEKGSALLLLENRLSRKTARVFEGSVYLDIPTIEEELEIAFYTDDINDLLIYNMPESMIIAQNEENILVKDGNSEEKAYKTYINTGGTKYVALDFLKEYCGIYFSYYDNPSRVVVHFRQGDYLYVEAKEAGCIRTSGDIKADILYETKAGEKLVFMDIAGNGFYKVMTADGIVGCILKKDTVKTGYMEQTYGVIQYEYSHRLLDEKVVMGWHMVTVKAANQYVEERIRNSDGLNVISPTWYRITDGEGNFTSLAEKSYVDKAHELGVQVWALIDDFGKDADTYSILSDTYKRHNLVERLLSEAEIYGFDGLNIDFEGISEKTGVHFIQFLRELSIGCRKAGLILSVDNYASRSANRHYDLASQKDVVDYVIIMAYDEYGAKSDSYGPVASYSFVYNAIYNTNELVPEQQIIVGVPFFSRIWMTSVENGNATLSSKAVSMGVALDEAEKNNAVVEWQNDKKLNYAEYKVDETTYRVWLEDTEALAAKMELIRESNVAGVAAWRLGLENIEAWDVINKYISE